MSFKIGFTAEAENDNKRIIENTPVQKEAPIFKKSVVEVFFPDRQKAYSYYNDMFDLKRGDVVYVEGKLEGLRGRVTQINYNFKISIFKINRTCN